MHQAAGFQARLLWLAALALLPACATAPPHGATVQRRPASVACTVDSRPAQVRQVVQVDRQRDQAEFEQAEAAWRRSDVAGCRRLLEQVVQRNPDHREANLRLTEVRLVERQPQLAMQRMWRFCQGHPEDARAHFLTALLLDAIGQRENSLDFFQHAAQLAPDDRLYQTGLELALAQADETPSPADHRVVNAYQYEAEQPTAPEIQTAATQPAQAASAAEGPIQWAYLFDESDR